MLGSLHSLQRGPEKEGLTKRVSFGGEDRGPLWVNQDPDQAGTYIGLRKAGTPKKQQGNL